MGCCMWFCENSGNYGPPPVESTFHKIPKEYNLRQLWSEALNVPEWELCPDSQVCSKHFQDVDFTMSENGEKILVDGAVPKLCLNTPENLEAVADLYTCRACLGMHRRMYHIRDNNLHQAYLTVVGVMVEATDRLPQMLCWECTARLMSCKAFKEKAQTSQRILSDKLAVNNILTVGDIKSINRINNKLNSHLTLKYSEPNEFDMQIDEFDLHLGRKVELMQEEIKFNKIKSEPPEVDTFIEQENSNVRNESNRISDSDNKIKSEPTAIDIFIELKQENSKVKSEKKHSSDTDIDSDNENDKDSDISLSSSLSLSSISLDSDDLKLAEAKLAPTSKKTIKKELKVINRKPPMTGAKKKSNVSKFRAKPDIPTFEFRRLSLEEQLQAQQARARSAAYVNAAHKCEVCYKVLKTEETLAMHALRHTEKSGQFECAICKWRYQQKKFLRHHMTRIHTERYSCKACSFVTANRRIAVEHQKWHEGGVTYTCPHCSTIFRKYTSYMSHLRVKHSSRYSCELCGYTFVSERGVQAHKVKSHALDKEIKLEGPYCEECELRFANDDAYQRHLTQSSVHSSDNDPNRVRNDLNHTLYQPKRRASGAAGDQSGRPRALLQNIPCEECGEQQQGYKAYAKHFRSEHPGLIRTKFPRATRRHNCMCEQCGKMFANKMLLQNHTASHSGEKRFKCDACDKAFASKNSLKVHRSVHGAQVPMHRCPYCEREFLHYTNCSRHVKTVHMGVKQFQCEICGKEFTSAGGKRGHVEHVHNKNPRPKRVRSRARPGADGD